MIRSRLMFGPSLALLTIMAHVGLAADPAAESLAARTLEWAKAATIHRDEWGIPHIEGPTDAAVVFAFAFAQCEDYFWQVEDTYIQALGRYAEVAGESGVRSDLLNRAFEIVPRSRADYPRLEPEVRELCEAFVAGLNHFLASHPDTKPRLIRQFEPWHVLAYCRQLNLTLDMVHAHAPSVRIPRVDVPGATASIGPLMDDVAAHMGSNAWAIGPTRTKSKRPILLINPHQPWFGYGQFYEAHLKSGEGWNFTGACFFGFPLPSIGHNEHLGWGFTFNEPNIMESAALALDSERRVLDANGKATTKSARRWRERLVVARTPKSEERTYEFLAIGDKPVVSIVDAPKLSSGLYIPRFHEICFLRQVRRMVRARTLAEFRCAMALQQLPLFNCVYGDVAGNIYYLYNAIVPRAAVNRSAAFHALPDILTHAELPQILNPRCDYLQSCNASPFRTCEEADNPSPGDYPRCLAGNDFADDKRRSRMSRRILRDLKNATLADVERLAFDRTSFWALSELPRYRQQLADLKRTDPKLAEAAEPYLAHLLDWNCVGGPDDTRMPLCVAWYDELYGRGYPAEILLEKYQHDAKLKFAALIGAAQGLEKLYGAWKVRWSEIYRIQRHPNVADFYKLPFSDAKPSLPSQGIPGPLGVIFTQYYSPQVQVPLLVNLKRRYGVVGTTYLSVVEFLDVPQARGLLQFGASGDPSSPHYMDQARLLSEMRLRPQWFRWDEVLEHAKRSYRPGAN